MTKATCKVDGCESPAKTRGWCASHYGLWHRNGDALRRQRQLIARTPIKRPELPDGPLTRAQEMVALATACVDDRTPTTLYRLFDGQDQLLYIGIAGNPGRRFEQHRIHKAWWGEVAMIRLQHFDYRRQAEEAETRAIIDERPPMNDTGADKAAEPMPTHRSVVVPPEPVRVVPGSLGYAKR